MKQDITSRKDIFFIISEFYQKMIKDDTLYPFFEEIISKNQLLPHLEIITDFWEDILLDTQKYKNNTMKKHLDKHALIKFKKQHFTLWISYLFKTIEENFQGKNSLRMKERATSIATVMQLKMSVFKK